MTIKVNILIDGGFFVQKFKEREHRMPKASDIKSEVGLIMEKIRKKAEKGEADYLFRIYYYDCHPFGGKKRRPDGVEYDFSTTDTFKLKEQVLKDLAQAERFAVRLGELSFDGWNDVKRKDTKSGKEIVIYKPILKQKGVDMKVGLDMALMALKHTVDKVVLVAGDSDFIAPMKFVRKEGILVCLYSMGHKIKSKLKEHCDFILS